MASKEIRVGAGDAGMRLDRFLAKEQPDLSRQTLRLLMASGQVEVNGRRARKGDRVVSGDVVTLDPEAAAVAAQPTSSVGVRVVLATRDFVIIDKAAGVPSAAVPGRVEGTAAGQLLSLFPELADVGYGPREPGLVHRLDTQTSGLLLAARTQSAFSQLTESMRRGAIDKRYLAIACGIAPPTGVIDARLEPDPRDRRRVVTRAEPGERRTTFKRLEVRSGHSLLEVSLARGYRHQIRAHLASIHLPLLGDVLYGGEPGTLGSRHALHASYMECTDGALTFRAEAPLPDDLQSLWLALARTGVGS